MLNASLYAYMYVTRETQTNSNEIIMCEQLHSMNLLLECATMCTVHYGVIMVVLTGSGVTF